eukprot:6775176-Prymnesium_polylepis.1
MRHVFRVRTPLNRTEWDTILAPVRSAAPHFMLTLEHPLLEPSLGEAARPGRGWRRASPEWKQGGHSSFVPREDGMD